MPKRKIDVYYMTEEINKVCPIYGIAQAVKNGPITRIDYTPDATPVQKGLATKLIRKRGWDKEIEEEIEVPYENLSNSEKIVYLEQRLSVIENKINRGNDE